MSMADPLTSDVAPESGSGSDADRLSMSPLSIRRGGADPDNVDEDPVQMGMGMFDYDSNPRQPTPPLEGTGAGNATGKDAAPGPEVK
jgi:hypothetical protein